MAGAQGSTMPAAAAEAEAGMDTELSCGSWAPNFGFAFDSERFSDKVLRIEIVANGEVAGGGSLTEPASHRAAKGAYSAMPFGPGGAWIQFLFVIVRFSCKNLQWICDAPIKEADL